MVTYQLERFSEVFEESLPLLRKHWQELARNKEEVSLDINVENYKQLEQSNILRVFTVRDSDVLIGYAVYLISSGLHYKSTSFATSDLFWLSKEYRQQSIGHGLFSFIEDTLKIEGIKIIHTSFKIEHPAAGFLLETLGHKPIEMVYEKVLT